MNNLVNSALSALSEGRRHLYELAEKLRSTPELGFFEVNTAEMLAAELEGAGVRVIRGLALTGLRAEVGPPGAPAIALLADMDALPT
ncbi:MAG: hypothetical protein WBH66_02830, partial [Rectinemataceae bacterium]